MYYDALSTNTVKITLTRKDMSDYSIREDCLRARSAETKRMLTRFLRRFQSESSLFAGRSADRLFLEAFPSDDGGCVMYVSTLGTQPLPPEETSSDSEAAAASASAPGTRTLMCIAGSLSDMAGLCAGLNGRLKSSSLYVLETRSEKCFVLIARAAISSADAVSRLMSEYGELSEDSTDIAFASEHGKRLCSGSAAALLAGLK